MFGALPQSPTPRYLEDSKELREDEDLCNLALETWRKNESHSQSIQINPGFCNHMGMDQYLLIPFLGE